MCRQVSPFICYAVPAKCWKKLFILIPYLHTIAAGLLICVGQGSTHYDILSEKYLVPDRNIHLLLDLSVDAYVQSGFVRGECNVIATESFFSGEGYLRALGYEGEYTVGEKFLSKEPMGIITRADDPIFSDLVNAVLQALILAEHYNITQESADLFPQTDLFGVEYKDVFRHDIAAGGSYGEIYERTIEGLIPRCCMNKYNEGSNSTGLLYAHPFGNIGNDRDGSPLGPTLRAIRERGTLVCGIRVRRPGFAVATAGGYYSGMDVDYCRALSASLFAGDDTAIEFVELDEAGSGFARLASKEVDVVAGAHWTLENDVREPSTGMGFSFSQPYFYFDDDEEDTGNDVDNLCLATRQDDHDWSSFCYWIVAATVYAEENNLGRLAHNQMPEVWVFGPDLQRMLRNAIFAVGNYAELYERNLQSLVPRGGRNRHARSGRPSPARRRGRPGNGAPAPAAYRPPRPSRHNR